MIPQTEFQRIISERLQKQQRQHTQQITEQLGRTPEEAAAIIAAHDAAVEAAKDDVTRANDAQTAAVARATQLEQEKHAAEVRADLILALSKEQVDAAGVTLPAVNPAHLDPVLALALPVALASTTPETAVDDAVTLVRSSAAPLFGTPVQVPVSPQVTGHQPHLPPPPMNAGVSGAAPAPVPIRTVAEGQQQQPTLEQVAVERFKAMKGKSPQS